MGRTLFALLVGATVPFLASASANPAQEPPAVKTPWYETISLRGYTQFRYNQLFVTNDKLVSEQGDKSIGGNNGFFIRRARLIFSGNPTERTFVYIQPDLASTPTGSTATHFAQIRDLYADIFLTEDKSLRLRLGQSKVPFGFENLQSSQNRLPLDRNDALNSAVKDERDMGAFIYWATPEVRKRFKMLVDSGLKGSGDYGIFAIGAYNGQLANQPEANKTLHAVTRLTYPFEVSSDQIVEAGIQGYTGRYVIKKDDTVSGDLEQRDQRVALSLTVYPQPFGLQAEYTRGLGPAFDPDSKTVSSEELSGGYVLVSYKQGSVIPYVRQQSYRGGRKHDTNSIYHVVDETEAGVEWQIDKSLELTACYVSSHRTNPKAPTQVVDGRFGRLQMQWNY
jgi:hypothetical protein